MRFVKGETKTNILLALLIIFGLRLYLHRLMDKSVYRGPYYSVAAPEGWERKKEDNKEKGEEMVFISPEKDYRTEAPHAMFAIFSFKSKGGLFIEDVMAEVYAALGRMQGEVLDKGEIKIDEEIAKWILFRNHNPDLMILTFYIVDDFNRFTRIQFTASAKKFNDYRPAFEKFKDSLKFKKLF